MKPLWELPRPEKSLAEKCRESGGEQRGKKDLPELWPCALLARKPRRKPGLLFCRPAAALRLPCGQRCALACVPEDSSPAGWWGHPVRADFGASHPAPSGCGRSPCPPLARAGRRAAPPAAQSGKCGGWSPPPSRLRRQLLRSVGGVSGLRAFGACQPPAVARATQQPPQGQARKRARFARPCPGCSPRRSRRRCSGAPRPHKWGLWGVSRPQPSSASAAHGCAAASRWCCWRGRPSALAASRRLAGLRALGRLKAGVRSLLCRSLSPRAAAAGGNFNAARWGRCPLRGQLPSARCARLGAGLRPLRRG